MRHNHRRSDGWRYGIVAAAGVVLGAWAAPQLRPAEAEAQGVAGVTKVEVVPDNGALLGDGDVRFGVVIEPEGGAIVTNWRNQQAYHVNPQGQTRELGFRTKHQHVGVAIPPGSIVVIEDLQGDYFAVKPDGQVAEIASIR